MVFITVRPHCHLEPLQPLFPGAFSGAFSSWAAPSSLPFISLPVMLSSSAAFSSVCIIAGADFSSSPVRTALDLLPLQPLDPTAGVERPTPPTSPARLIPAKIFFRYFFSTSHLLRKGSQPGEKNLFLSRLLPHVLFIVLRHISSIGWFRWQRTDTCQKPPYLGNMTPPLNFIECKFPPAMQLLSLPGK